MDPILSARGKAVMILACIALVFGLFIGIYVWVGATWSSTEASEMTCVYNGGPLDNRDFRGYVRPGGGRNYQGFKSSVVDVPTRLIQYRVSKDPEQGDTPTPDFIATRVKGYLLEWEPTVTFTLNTLIREDTNGRDKPVVCDLIEQHLRAFDATDFNVQGGNWQFKFLNERWRPVLNDVMTRVMQNGYDPGELKFNTGGARDRAAAEVGSALNDALIALLGDDFFCDSDYRFGQGKEACGETFSIVLPEPSLSDEDETQLAKPQRAKVDADNAIAEANERARQAAGVASAKTAEASSATELADAQELIATQQKRVEAAQAEIDYAWCDHLIASGGSVPDCYMMLAAQNKNFPTVFGGAADPNVLVPVTVPPADGG